MLGNWSFGDYYKAEAIEWAWELLTREWGLPKDKLWATVYLDDDEAEKLWAKISGLPPQRIKRFGEKENFWEMGETGPCGPCSEVHLDRGPAACDKQGKGGHECRVNGDCARYIELWNLVFIQYNRNPDRSLSELPAKHVDTGMGLERITAVLQNVLSNYDIDFMRALITATEQISGKRYGADPDSDVSFRVIADHARAVSFLIGDGVIPGNEGRGYGCSAPGNRFSIELPLTSPPSWETPILSFARKSSVSVKSFGARRNGLAKHLKRVSCCWKRRRPTSKPRRRRSSRVKSLFVSTILTDFLWT
jgi:alanyl-tRNA synthetase